jgi:hypothetical protein
MKTFLTLLLATLCAASSYAQTIKALGYNTTNGQIVYSGTNTMTFTNPLAFTTNAAAVTLSNLGFWDALMGADQSKFGTLYDALVDQSINVGKAQRLTESEDDVTYLVFDKFDGWRVYEPSLQNWQDWDQAGTTNKRTLREAIGFSTNLNTLWLATNASGARSAIDLNFTNEILFGNTTVSNGTLYVFKTNTGPFEGLANLISSNNTTLSNETLFRVGLAEETNRSAQFGFRVVRTNNGGEGLAVFSVFGYNALMMIGPSDRSRTNTATNAAVEADIWTINQTNRVMTLRDTNTGALTMHQDLGFGAGLTNTSPTNTNTPAVWLRVWIGTNSYRLPLYQ